MLEGVMRLLSAILASVTKLYQLRNQEILAGNLQAPLH